MTLTFQVTLPKIIETSKSDKSRHQVRWSWVHVVLNIQEVFILSNAFHGQPIRDSYEVRNVINVLKHKVDLLKLFSKHSKMVFSWFPHKHCLHNLLQKMLF